MFKSRNLCRVVPMVFVMLGLVGCEDKTGVKQETTYTSPEGKTKITKETKVETSGDQTRSTSTTTTPNNP